MPLPLEIGGLEFGNVTAIKRIGVIHTKHGSRTHWLVRCKCGKRFSASLGNLRSGKTTNCNRCGHLTHGASGTPLYNQWTCMLSCRAGRSKAWSTYEAFARTVGSGPPRGKPYLRRRHPNRPWGPLNYQWTADPSRRIADPKGVYAAARKLGISPQAVYARMKRGYTTRQAKGRKRMAGHE